MAEIKYPEQIYKCARTDKTLGIDAKLFKANTGNGQSPLEMHSGYSRFVFTILAKGNGTYEHVSANLPPAELDLIKKQTDIAVEKLANKTLEPEPDVSIAYTETFFTGAFKGKAPATVLLENEANKAPLLEYRKQLEANLGRYPRNKDKIDAIDEAIKLLDSKQLKSGNSKSQILDIYRADIRAPHAGKTDEDGYTDVYSFSVVCDLSKNYPFAVNIMNCKTLLTKNANGTVTPNMKSAKDKREHSMLLTTSEWYKAMARMARTNELFEESIFNEMLEISKAHSFHYDK